MLYILMVAIFFISTPISSSQSIFSENNPLAEDFYFKGEFFFRIFTVLAQD